MIKSFIILLFAIMLSSCTVYPVVTVTPTLTATNTPEPTITATITPIPSITPTPTPVTMGTCSDQDSIKRVVDTFLADNGYSSYALFLEAIPSIPEECDNYSIYGCINMVTDRYLNKWYQTANFRAMLIGSFEANYKPESVWGKEQTCLLFANKDIPYPLPVLGAVQMEKYYSVSILKLTAFYTEAMTKEHFDEWINLHVGRMVNLGIILYFYEDTLSQNPYTNSYLRPNVMRNIVERKNTYPYEFASTKIEMDDESEQHLANLEIIKSVLEKYDVLYPTELFADGWTEDVEYFKSHVNLNTQPNTDELIFYDDSLSNRIDNIYISGDATCNLKSPNVYSGNYAIGLQTQGNYIQFKPEFWDHPINVSNYDFLEFYLKTSGFNYSLAITGEHDEVYDSSYSPSFIGSNNMDFNRPYAWLGTLSGDPQRWRLVQIPISTLDQDQDGKINGISFEFYSDFGDVFIDEIKLVAKD